MAKVPVVVELYYSGAWHDITATNDVYTRDPLTITRGRPDAVQRVPPSTLDLTLDNRDGTFSPRNPASPLYGLIGRNTPIRVKVTGLRNGLSLSGASGTYASTPDNAALDIVGDIDIRAEISPADWTPAAGSTIVAKFLGPSNLSYLFYLETDGTLHFAWSANGSSVVDNVGSTVPVPVSSGRLAVRAAIDVNNGASGRTITFYTALTINGTWTQLGAPVVTAGVTSIFSGSALLEIGAHTGGTLAPFAGTIHAAEVRNSAGTAVANPNFGAQAIGATSFADAAGRTWTLNGTAAIVDVPSYRFVGEVESWPQRWAVKGDAWTPITANGILRRRNAPGTTQPAFSPLRRAMLDSNPIGYWHMEDTAQATTIASGLTNGLPMVFGTVPPLPGNETIAPGSVAGVDVGNEGSATGLVTGGSNGSWSVSFITNFLRRDSDLTNVVTVVAGGITAQALQGLSAVTGSFFGPGGSVSLTGAQIAATNAGNRRPHHVVLSATQAGADATVTVRIDGVLTDTDTLTGVTVVPPTSVTINGDPALTADTLADGTSLVFGHLAVYDSVFTTDLTTAIAAYAGETAVQRIVGLCAEEGLTVRVIGSSADSALMGVQRAAPVLDLLADAADADGGILFEDREVLGLVYRTHNSLYSQDTTLTLSYSAGAEVAPSIEPIEDTDATGNDITVTRYQGGSVNLVKETGTLNVQEPAADPNGVGRYAKDITLVLAADDQCLQQAAWTRHLGTWDEARYPVVNLDLTAMTSAALKASAADLDVGDRFSITNPPAWIPPDSIEQRAQGFTEVIESHHWTIAANATPALPYDVLRLENDTASNLSRIPTGGSTLAGTMTTTSTSRTVNSAGAVWIDSATYPTQFPFDIIVAGERMRVTAITGTTSPQTFTVTRSINGIVKAQASGAAIQLFRPPVIAR